MSSTNDYNQLMEKKPKLNPIPVRLDPDVREAIERLAKADERSLSAYINRALRQHVEAHKARKTPSAKPAK